MTRTPRSAAINAKSAMKKFAVKSKSKTTPKKAPIQKKKAELSKKAVASKKETREKVIPKKETVKKMGKQSKPEPSEPSAEYWSLGQVGSGKSRKQVAVHVKPGQAPRVIELDPNARTWPIPSCLLD